MKSKKKKYFRLFANCIPVQGATRSIICDLQKGGITDIPGEIMGLLKDADNNVPIGDIKASFNHEEDKGIDLFFDALVDSGLGFYTHDASGFIPLSEEWDFPGSISNAIIDIGNTDLPFGKIIGELELLHCPHIQLRFFILISNEKLIDILSGFNNSGIRSVELVIPHDPLMQYEGWMDLYKEFTRLSRILIYNSPSEELGSINQVTIEKVTRAITDHRDCGIINSDFFMLNPQNFMEARKHNSCLNRKIAVTADGEIKNCPGMAESYGNIRDNSLTDAISRDGFKKYWDVKKDDIAVCRDCEFRYICTDCRAYIENPADEFSKPLKCGYDPYTGMWEEWSTHPLKQKAIDHYNMRELLFPKLSEKTVIPD